MWAYSTYERNVRKTQSSRRDAKPMLPLSLQRELVDLPLGGFSLDQTPRRL